MKIFSLYQDFFHFLEYVSPNSEKWNSYSKFYYTPHQDFFESYFSCFPALDEKGLRERVERIKVSDYSCLKSLVSQCQPEKILQETYDRCMKIAFPPVEPDVYLLVGFFSPDGFVLNHQGKPVICFGLERFRDFRLLKILFAHEFAHFLLNLQKRDVSEQDKWKWILLSEGIATCFSYSVFPGHRLSDHFFFRRDRLDWCQEHEEYLRKVHHSGKYSNQELQDLYKNGNPDLDIPPRAGKYLGFMAVKKYLDQNKEKGIGRLLGDSDLLLSLDLS